MQSPGLGPLSGPRQAACVEATGLSCVLRLVSRRRRTLANLGQSATGATPIWEYISICLPQYPLSAHCTPTYHGRHTLGSLSTQQQRGVLPYTDAAPTKERCIGCTAVTGASRSCALHRRLLRFSPLLSWPALEAVTPCACAVRCALRLIREMAPWPKPLPPVSPARVADHTFCSADLRPGLGPFHGWRPEGVPLYFRPWECDCTMRLPPRHSDRPSALHRLCHGSCTGQWNRRATGLRASEEPNIRSFEL